MGTLPNVNLIIMMIIIHTHKAGNTQGKSTYNKANDNKPCKGCGRIHWGDCIFSTHPHFNITELPWSESEWGKRYFQEKGASSLPNHGPYLDGVQWVRPQQGPGSAENNSTEPQARRGGRWRSQFQRKDGRPRGISVAAITEQIKQRRVLIVPITIYLPNNRRRTLQALIDTGSPSDYISPALASWLKGNGVDAIPHEECVCVV
jgi:hypothetical protein